MDFSPTDDERMFRAEVRTWLAQNVPSEPLPSGDTREGFVQHVAWEKRLFEAGLAVVSWPVEYGGRGASLMQWLIFEEEYYRAGAPSRVTQNGICLLAPTLFTFGTPEQRARILPKMAAAEQLWAQGWSEPEAGSDLAAIKSSAVRTDGGWLLSGQKTWCTRASFCDALFGLFRTDPNVGRHGGLTYFMVDLKADGVTVRGFDRLDGDEGFAEVFLDDVFVGDGGVIGDVDEGWRVAMTTASSERGLTLRSPGRFLATAERLVALHCRQGSDADPSLRDGVVQAWVEAQAYHVYTLRTATRISEGETIGAESSVNKLFWSEMDVRTHETALALLGGAAELEGGPAAVDEGAWMKGYQFALAGPIYAGTNEVQRNVVARRVLGLPRK
ncbi:MAG: acyl-CoA dehydrogenase family protein [Myxococcota bacterium]|nr:acyl-CoA dehydrogenase family protein [Myxococcota bacterium]